MRSLSDHVQSELENYRSVRYRSEEQAVALGLFAPGDRGRIRQLYDFLVSLDQVLQDPAALGGPEALIRFTELHDISALIHGVRGLGRDVSDLRLAAALHDIRGGALTALFLHLARIRHVPHRTERVLEIAIGTRDHMKIMRNVVVDIDVDARERDLAMIPHTLGELASALAAFTATVGDRQIVTTVDCEGDGTVIAETCVECAAVDRVAYNLLNNAAAHATTPAIDVWLAPRDGNLRVAVANTVSNDQIASVQRSLDEDPTALYASFTTTGSGYGLRIVSELVARAYGVVSVGQLVEKGYVGAKLVEGAFLSWFHWPLSPAEVVPPIS